MSSSRLTAQDLHLFNEGTHRRLHRVLGAHPTDEGTHFAVWAPSAAEVSVVGDFNEWSPSTTPLQPVGSSGIWCALAADASPGALYKYRIRSRDRCVTEKADPCGRLHEGPPATASIV